MVQKLYDEIFGLENTLLSCNNVNSGSLFLKIKRLSSWLIHELKKSKPENIKIIGKDGVFIDFLVDDSVYIINGKEGYYNNEWLKYIGLCIRNLGVDEVMSVLDS
jgi:hypothetical protein